MHLKNVQLFLVTNTISNLALPMLLSSTDEQFLSQYLSNNEEIIISFITKEYANMAFNWYEWAKKCCLNNKVLVCCLDPEAYIMLKEKNIPCIHTDQNIIYNTIENKTFGSFYRLPRHVCKLHILDSLTSKYDISILYTDVDMIILKDPCNKVNNELINYDTCVYTNKTYSELAQGVKYGSHSFDKGGMVLMLNKKVIKKIISIATALTDINADSPKDKGIGSIAKLFNLRVKMLNALEFTNIDIWQQDHIRKVIQNYAYIVHYNMFDDVTKLSAEKLMIMIDKKIQAMKKYDHWII